MQSVSKLSFVLVVSFATVFLTACGKRAPVQIADLPIYTRATELQPGNSPIANTLQKNEAQAKAMGQKIEQKAFNLPVDASWDKLIGFYTEQLKTNGWKEGVAMGGPGSGMANDMVKKAMAQANAGSDLFKTAIFTRDRQILTIMRLANATGKNDVELLVSLNTN